MTAISTAGPLATTDDQGRARRARRPTPYRARYHLHLGRKLETRSLSRVSNPSTGDTNKTITTTVSPGNVPFSPVFAWGLNYNLNSACQAGLDFSSGSGSGSVNTTVTAAQAGCSGSFNAQAAVSGSTSSTPTLVIVPPQVMIQTLVGEAGAQTAPGDATMPSLLLVAENRFGDTTFPGGSAATWQAVLVPSQFYGASNATANGVEPELDYAAEVFSWTTPLSIPPGCKGYWSPTNSQFATLQTWAGVAAGSAVNWASVGAPQFSAWAGQPKQAVVKSSIANNLRTDGPGYNSAPAIVLFQLAPSGSAPAVITIP